MARVQEHSVRSDSLQQIRLQSFLEHAEADAASHVGSERGSHAGADVALQWKQAAAESGVTARAMRNRGAARSQAIQFGIGGMNVMRHYSVRAAESESFVHRQVVGRPRKEPRGLRNLLQVFVE